MGRTVNVVTCVEMSSFRLISILFLLSFLDFSAVKGAPFSGQEETIKGNATIYFQLFTRKNPTEFQILLLNDVEALKKSNYNPDALVKLYAPGWDNDGSIAYPTKDEYLLREDCNVIVIDWREVQSPIYIDTIGTTTRTGLHTGAFIDFLIDNGTPKSAFHLIGHSAGTHVVGVGSAALKSGRVSRITGLDPGRYPTYNSDIELDITDADFVEIVHTNGGTDLDDRAIFDAIGHVDFYANGGHHQPGCEDSSGLFSLQ